MKKITISRELKESANERKIVNGMNDGTFGNLIGLDGIILGIKLFDKRCYAIKTHDCRVLKS